jgi:hypothetical protein
LNGGATAEGGEFEERQQRMIEGIIKQTVNL